MQTSQFQNPQADPMDLTRLIRALWRRKWLVAGAAFAGLLLALVITFAFVSPKYQSSVMFYVNNNALSFGDPALGITSSDISASKGLVDSYIVILNARETLVNVIAHAEVDLDCEALEKMLSAEAVRDTQIFRVVVTSEDPLLAEKIASAIAYILPRRISSIIEGTSAKIVDPAAEATEPSSPDYWMSGVQGFLAGLLLSAGGILLWAILDVTVREESDVVRNCRYPILASVPEWRQEEKADAAEAYKLLRTKLGFSLGDGSGGHVVGITSARKGEGKSLTAVQLAAALAQLDKRVILLDCDLRHPTLAEKLHLRKKPGLSGFLTGQAESERLLQPWTPKEGGSCFVVCGGERAANSVELLSSRKMETFVTALKKRFDYVLLDLPSVEAGSDALAVAKYTDGVLLVVRRNLCSQPALGDLLDQLAFVNARILGVVYNGSTERAARPRQRRRQDAGKPKALSQ